MRAGYKCVASPSLPTTRPISAGSVVKILQLFRHLVGTLSKFGPGRADIINQASFNLDKLLFMGYIYFKCNNDLPPKH